MITLQQLLMSDSDLSGGTQTGKAPTVHKTFSLCWRAP
jgi:hypothetical protein